MAHGKLWLGVLGAALLGAAVLGWVLLSQGAGCSSGCSFSHAAVAADSKLCSDIGRDMLQRGGSAVDGTIAALLCTSLVNPQSSGLGGGAIFTIRETNGQVKVFSSRETVPKTFKADLLKDCPNKFTFITGSQWVGVPGELLGYQLLHQRYGRLPWAELFQPSIRLARGGMPLPKFLACLLSRPPIGRLVRGSSLCQLFCRQNQSILGNGDMLTFPRLADTLETIAEHGADTLYRGQLGLDLVQDVREAGGTLSMEDLESFQVRVSDAWSVSLGTMRLHVPPPPSGGPLLAFILNVMKGFNLTSASMSRGHRVETYHRYVEATKFANGQKEVIRDPKFNEVTNASYLLDEDFAKRTRKLISWETRGPEFYNNNAAAAERSGTSHVSVLDEDGMAVSATSTINHIFGSALVSRRTGLILNNQLADFCGRTETFRAGEQPPSSMTPSILDSSSGDTLVIGGSGGSMITTAVALAVMKQLWAGLTLQEAIADPIVFVDSENKLKFEPNFDKTVIEGLKVRGHQVDDWLLFFNVVNAVAKKEGCLTAASDARKMGQASGY